MRGGRAGLPGNRAFGFERRIGQPLAGRAQRPDAKAAVGQGDGGAGGDPFKPAAEHVRQDGYAVIDQEVELGLRSLAVPLKNVRGQVVAALNTGVAATQTTAVAMKDQFAEPLLRTQAGLMRVLA